MNIEIRYLFRQSKLYFPDKYLKESIQIYFIKYVQMFECFFYVVKKYLYFFENVQNVSFQRVRFAAVCIFLLRYS